jgi:rhomboid protease GluP
MSESRFSFALSSPTAVLFAVHVIVYALMLLTGGRDELSGLSGATLTRFGADYAPLVFEGQVHRLVAATFLHINVWHLLMNSAALVSIGPRAEALFGRGRYVALYLASGLGGSLASIAVNYREPIVSAGASGALCGAIAAVAVAAYRQGASARGELSAMLLWLGATLIFGVLIGADNAAHVGGMVVGAGVALSLRGARREPGGVRASAVVVAATLLAFGGAAYHRGNSRTASQLVNHGVELARAGDNAGAAVSYRRAIALEPRDAIAHYDLGLALTRLKEYPDAIVHLNRAVELAPEEDYGAALAGAYINHGVALASAKQHREAIAAYRAALALDAAHPQAHYNLALSLDQLGERSAAIDSFNRAVELEASELHSESLADALARDGMRLMERKDYKQAAKRFTAAEKHAPSDADHPMYLGLSLMHAGELEAAVGALKRAVRVGDSQSTRAALASALEKRQAERTSAGDISGALDDAFEEAVLGIAPPGSGLPGKPVP